jgi:hypothetical protein
MKDRNGFSGMMRRVLTSGLNPEACTLWLLAAYEAACGSPQMTRGKLADRLGTNRRQAQRNIARLRNAGLLCGAVGNWLETE